MTLTYIFHSGFALETDDALIIFDYWMDPARVVPRLLRGAKRVYVFASHFHEDHFTRDILQWRSEYPSTIFTYILAKDILRHRRARRDEADVWMGKGAEWSDGCLHVVATGSNDSGVSWIVEVEGRRIFHAGDLNNWYARFLASDTPGSIIRSTEFGIDAIDGEFANYLIANGMLKAASFPGSDKEEAHSLAQDNLDFLCRNLRRGVYVQE